MLQTLSDARVLVWPWWLRALHWSLAVTVIASFATHEGGGVWHLRWGYAAIVVAALRVLMGLRGSDPTRAWRDGCAAPQPLGAIPWPTGPLAHWRGHAPRYVGHNPFGPG